MERRGPDALQGVFRVVSAGAPGVTQPRDPEKFIARLMEHFGPDGAMDMDCFDFVDWASDAGLIEEYQYDPGQHGEMLGDPEPGDMLWKPVPVGGRPE